MSTWFIGNWYDLIPQPWLALALVTVAILCGAIVGIEREKKEKAAGLRTLTLVTVGSAVFTMISIGLGSAEGDPGRIAAQVVTGIGFLGAGAILRGEKGVQGLTTAATIWAVAATGMTVGWGMPARAWPSALASWACCTWRVSQNDATSGPARCPRQR